MENSPKRYTVSGLTKSSGLLPDINLLIANWDEAKTVEGNFDDAIRRNLFAKASRKRIAEILRIFRQRYLAGNPSDRAFRAFVGSTLPSEITDRIVYYHTVLAEPALYDFVAGYLSPLYLRGERRITVRNALDFVADAIHEGKTEGKWESEATRVRVAQGLLSTLKDFSVLEGTRSPEKTLAPAHLHVLAFAYIAFHIKLNEPSGERLANHPHWRLFFLGPRAVESYFGEADAERLLTYQAAGSIIRIEFPTTDFEEYVHGLTARAF